MPILSTTTLPDIDPTQLPFSKSTADRYSAAIGAGCTAAEMAAPFGTPGFASCSQKVAIYRLSHPETTVSNSPLAASLHGILGVMGYVGQVPILPIAAIAAYFVFRKKS